MKGMLGNRQFSIRYMLLETFWIALSLGLIRYAVAGWNRALPPDQFPLMVLMCLTLPGVLSIAVFGLFGYMREGAICGATIFVFLFLPLLFPFVQ